MQDTSVETGEPDQSDQIFGIVERMLQPLGVAYLRPVKSMLGSTTPFDFSKPNEHDSKAEFLREQKVVSESLDHLTKLLKLMVSRDDEGEHAATMKRIKPIVDYKLFSNAPRAYIDNPVELIRKNVADVGGFTASMFVLMDLRSVLSDRLVELQNQEQQFWSMSHRPPDHYARAIALRLARVYCNETGQRPTLGTSGETGDPSTSYSRALKEVFDVLGISTAVRTPAEWALGQLTEQDLARPENHIAKLGSIFGMRS